MLYRFPNKSIDEDKRKTLVLDLDETLVHSWEDPEFLNEFQIYTDPEKFRFFHPSDDVHIAYSMELPSSLVWGIHRPHLNRFLNTISKHYNVIVWSAGIRPYVNEIVKNIFLDAGVRPPALVWAREQCRNYKGLYHKPIADLTKGKLFTIHVDPSQTMIIDDRLHTFMLNPQNGVLIPPFDPGQDPTWEELIDRSDDTLLHLEKWLLSPEVLHSEDVRVLNKDFMNGSTKN